MLFVVDLDFVLDHCFCNLIVEPDVFVHVFEHNGSFLLGFSKARVISRFGTLGGGMIAVDIISLSFAGDALSCDMAWGREFDNQFCQATSCRCCVWFLFF